VVVTHDPPAGMLDRCLQSLAASGDADVVVVVDNGGRARPSPDGVDVVHTTNRGFGAAANTGIARARERGATQVALLNDDVEVEPGWLAPLVAELAGGERIGAVQPKLVMANTAPRLVASVGVELDRFGAGQDLGLGQLDGDAFDGARDIPICTGGAVLFDVAFLDDVGGFDERWFLYYEDVDLALRGAARGWRYRCAPASVVRHVGSATTAGLGDRRAMLLERNRLWCLFRHGSATSVARGLWLSARRMLHAPRRAHSSGLARGLLGAPRMLATRRR